MMRFALRLLIVALLIVGVSSCATKNRFDVMKQADKEQTVPLRVVVTDFEDKRPFEEFMNRTLSIIPIAGIRAGYFYDRHDEIYSGTTQPFRQLFGQGLAKRLEDAKVFQSVVYAPADKMPERGEYDLLITGNMNKLRSAGGFYRWGFSIFAELLWYVGIPYLDRHWEIDVDYQVVNGYTREPIGPAKNVEFETGTTFFTRYYQRGKTTDLQRKLVPVYDEFIDWFWTQQPGGNEAYWADLKTGGERLLAQQRAEAEVAKRGTPPTLTFLAPTDGETVRTPSVAVRYSIAAPNGLRGVAMAVNNNQVDLGINALSLADVTSAPRSVPPQEVNVRLKLGDNKVDALVTDHRDNKTPASMTIRRLPTALRPMERHAMVIAEGSAAAIQAGELQTVLSDPILGQFQAANLKTIQAERLTREAVETGLRDFGARPLAGNLVLVVVRASGNWSDLTIGEGLPLNDFVATLQRSLATNEVVLMLDINWTGGPSDQEIGDRLENVPSRWAVLAASSNGAAAREPVLLNALAATMKGREGDTDRLTLERLLDRLQSRLQDQGAKPGVYGRFDPSITMVERE